jgi:hypothetical protein
VVVQVVQVVQLQAQRQAQAALELMIFHLG